MKNSILVVDDEKMNLEVLHGILSPEYNVHITKSGASAIELAGKNLPDLILLDIIMVDMNGFKVLEALKSSEKTKDIPVIIITGLESDENEEKGLELGAVDFIHKPFSIKTVKSRVKHQIQIVNQIRTIKQYAQNMQLALSRMEAVTNNFRGVIWSIDNDGEIISFNGQYLNDIGISPSFLVGKNIEVARAKNRHLDIIDNIEKTFREGSQSWQSEINGVIFQSHTMLMTDNDGNIMGIVGSSYNVTELVKLQQNLEIAVRTAEIANHSKSSFLARMSHEIRTPLNAVLGISEIQLQNENLQHDVREAFIRIFNSGDLLLSIINDILDMSKIEAGKLELMPSWYDVPSMINDTVFLNIIKYENKPIEFILNVDENVPSVLYGDELRIKQILNNLLSNAFKYTKKGEVVLSFYAEHSSDSSAEKPADSVTLVFSVRDTGQGMTKEQMNKLFLFEEYTRFNMEANRTTEGTGLGMNITRNLIQMMNGVISAESNPGSGSLFTVRLPQGNTDAPPIGKETVEHLKQFSPNFETRMEKMHIVREPIPFGKVLVVDDMEMNLYVSKGMLSPYGLDIDTATSGHEAIEKIKGNLYDLVFMDHMMPVMDGIEATKEIRKLGPEYEKLPIIALTANAVSGMKEMFLANGFNGFLSKPIIIQELDNVLKEHMLPEKITSRTENKTADADESYDSFLNDAGKIDEINTETGLNQLSGDKSIYYNTLNIFYNKLISECDKMTSSLNAGEINNFMISVHAMKSMLAIIGALALSETALELETASKSGDIDYCTQRFPELREKLSALHKQLAAIFNNGEGEKEQAAAAAPAPGSTEEKPQKGRVLVVDDMEMLLYVIKEKLSLYGLQVDTASSGHEAIEKARGNAYDIVFMDHMMPEMDGIEAAAEIRKLGHEYQKLSIIALTANTDPGTREMFLANGFNGYISKPVAAKELAKILEEWLPACVSAQ